MLDDPVPGTRGLPVEEVAEVLRSRGLRMTSQRERVLRAVARLVHGTPEEVSAMVNADGGSLMPPSTVYRNLDTLERIGAVSRTQLGKRAPSYHLASHGDHVHVVCSCCREVGEAPVDGARAFAAAVEEASGFVVDLRHMAVQGWCAECAPEVGHRSTWGVRSEER
ncbi:nickel uptake regulator, Fur family [Austwickia chelonae]|uniref:Putative transcriptional regulator n=1 Tax=Austwickia chelonae NBRC 105200 TaxID=1184607 RepID=K6VR17_9MICO|nr:Fur family transcriptional regulator [Austwickia chelonae]GAB77815.1 putative transcriptional regulator [Austwickia chelonae NBRC 105200]SEV90048.1 nickel uptake regulator, Fur family [Austwickia chelonae]